MSDRKATLTVDGGTRLNYLSTKEQRAKMLSMWVRWVATAFLPMTQVSQLRQPVNRISPT